MFLFERVFWSRDEGEESPVTSIPETDPKEAGRPDRRQRHQLEGGGTQGGWRIELGRPPLFSFTVVPRPSPESPRWSGAMIFSGLTVEEKVGD